MGGGGRGGAGGAEDHLVTHLFKRWIIEWDSEKLCVLGFAACSGAKYSFC